MTEIMTLSSRYRVTIPKSVRELTGWRPGDKIMPVMRGRLVTLVPLLEMEELYGRAARTKMGPIEDEKDES